MGVPRVPPCNLRGGGRHCFPQVSFVFPPSDRRLKIQPAMVPFHATAEWRWLVPVRAAHLGAGFAVMAAEPRRPSPRKLGGWEASSVDERADFADVRAARNGDDEAFARLVSRHQRPIASYLWRFTRDRQQWEGLVHDVFVEAFLSLSGYRGEAPLLHWLKRIATRVGYRCWRNNRRRKSEVSLTSIGDPPSGSTEGGQAIAEACELVHQLLAMLSPRDRLVMTLFYLEGHTIREVAALTGWSESLTKVQAHRARKRLQKLCHERGIEP